jgi:DNA-binding FrmR family transcriptional regulator
MDDKARADAIHRLKSVSGHVNGVIKMLEDERYCIDVIKQIQAIETALARVSETILDSHLRTCVITAVQGDDVSDRERVLNEVMEVYRYVNKP